MRNGDSHVFLTDFGLAKNVATGSKYTRTGETLGTPQYMSPEQARGDLAELTPATDTWALGCVLYELLAGRPAFDGETTAAVIARVMAGTPRPLPLAVPHVQHLVDACLAKAPALRPPDAGRFATDAARVLAGERPHTRRASRGRRHALVAAITVAASALAGWALWQAAGQGPPPQAPHSAEAERLATQAWGLRQSEPAQARAMLGRACELEPNRAAWWLNLGLLRWAAGDLSGAESAWARVPEPAPESTRAWWFRGLAHEAAGVEAGTQPHFDRAAERWRRAAAGTGIEAQWAQAGLALGRFDLDEARALLGEPQDWSAALLQALIDVEAMRRGEPADNARIVALFTQALTDGLPMPWAHTSRGMARHRLGDLAGARRDYDRAIALLPDGPVAYLNRSNVRRESGDAAGARADVDDAIRLKPDFAPALVNRGLLRFHAGDLEGARHDFDRAIAADPADADAFQNRAVVHKRLGDLDHARRDCDQALAIHPAHAKALNTRGTLRQAQGDLDGARADFDAAIRQDPQSKVALYNRGRLRERLRDLAGAQADYEQAIAIDSKFAGAYISLGYLHQRRGRLAEAERHYDRAIAANPQHAAAHCYRGGVRQMQQQWAGARADYDRCLELDPNYWAAYDNRGVLRQTRGDPEGARRDFDRALRLQPSSAQTLVNRGLLRLTQRDWNGAEADLQQGLKLDPRLAIGFRALGYVHAQRQEWREAIAALRRFLELAPTSPLARDVRTLLADCERRLAAGG